MGSPPALSAGGEPLLFSITKRIWYFIEENAKQSGMKIGELV